MPGSIGTTRAAREQSASDSYGRGVTGGKQRGVATGEKGGGVCPAGGNHGTTYKPCYARFPACQLSTHCHHIDFSSSPPKESRRDQPFPRWLQQEEECWPQRSCGSSVLLSSIPPRLPKSFQADSPVQRNHSARKFSMSPSVPPAVKPFIPPPFCASPSEAHDGPRPFLTTA